MRCLIANPRALVAAIHLCRRARPAAKPHHQSGAHAPAILPLCAVFIAALHQHAGARIDRQAIGEARALFIRIRPPPQQIGPAQRDILPLTNGLRIGDRADPAEPVIDDERTGVGEIGAAIFGAGGHRFCPAGQTAKTALKPDIDRHAIAHHIVDAECGIHPQCAETRRQNRLCPRNGA